MNKNYEFDQFDICCIKIMKYFECLEKI